MSIIFDDNFTASKIPKKTHEATKIKKLLAKQTYVNVRIKNII